MQATRTTKIQTRSITRQLQQVTPSDSNQLATIQAAVHERTQIAPLVNIFTTPFTIDPTIATNSNARESIESSEDENETMDWSHSGEDEVFQYDSDEDEELFEYEINREPLIEKQYLFPTDFDYFRPELLAEANVFCMENPRAICHPNSSSLYREEQLDYFAVNPWYTKLLLEPMSESFLSLAIVPPPWHRMYIPIDSSFGHSMRCFEHLWYPFRFDSELILPPKFFHDLLIGACKYPEDLKAMIWYCIENEYYPYHGYKNLVFYRTADAWVLVILVNTNQRDYSD